MSDIKLNDVVVYKGWHGAYPTFSRGKQDVYESEEITIVDGVVEVKFQHGLWEPIEDQEYDCISENPLKLRGNSKFAPVVDNSFQDVFKRISDFLSVNGVSNIGMVNLYHIYAMFEFKIKVWYNNMPSIEELKDMFLSELKACVIRYRGSCNGAGTHHLRSEFLLSIMYGLERMRVINSLVDNNVDLTVEHVEGTGFVIYVDDGSYLDLDTYVRTVLRYDI